MATPSQIEANRLNTFKSTGPRSAEGKETSRFNALKNGIEAESLVLPGEDPERLAALTRNYLVQFLPVGPVEERLVRSLTLSDWHQERFARIEAKIVALSLDPALDYESAGAMLYGKDGNSLALRHVFRRQQAAQRGWTNSAAPSPGDPVALKSSQAASLLNRHRYRARCPHIVSRRNTQRLQHANQVVRGIPIR